MDCKIDNQMHLLGDRRILQLQEIRNMMMYFKDEDCFAFVYTKSDLSTLALVLISLMLCNRHTRHFDAQYCGKNIILSHQFLLAKVSS